MAFPSDPRRLRAALVLATVVGLTLAGAVTLFVAISGVLSGRPYPVLTLAIGFGLFAAVGAATGFTFSVVLAAFGRGKTVAGIRRTPIALAGAVAGLLFSSSSSEPGSMASSITSRRSGCCRCSRR